MHPMLGIRDILVRIRIPGSEPYLLLIDPYPGPTPFFIDLKDAKKNCFSYFFLITCPQAHHLQSKKLNFLVKFCVKMTPRYFAGIMSVSSTHL